MSKKRYIVHVWFLDNDLQSSAQMMTDKCLNSTINGCIGCITSVCMYMAGIRSKKFYSHFFSKDNVQNTLNTVFKDWPLNKNPSFNSYSWKESKWCRMCHENYDLIVEYLSILLDEYIWRHSRSHSAYSMLKWAQSNELADSLPYVGSSEIVFPWKSIDPRFRTEDIIGGYCKMYCATQIDDGDPFVAYSRCKRDIPDFVVEEFHLEDAFER